MEPPDRWHTIDGLFAEALDRPPEERAAFLQKRCGRDHALRHKVEALLKASSGGATLLDAPLDDGALWKAFVAAEHPPRTSSLIGKQVGAYRLVQEIGHGGMSTVYLAERADGQFDQQVAIKILWGAAGRASHIERFLSERRILASLQHPHIATLHDGGITEDGRPYFVMEYVEGRPIDRYCDEECLSIKERLELFATVGEAVQYAHQNLVVHRDLKPSNILVKKGSEKGKRKSSPMLLDFGIAKLLTDVSGEKTPVTRTGERWMTPEYASPEQVTGETFTTASDVYQFGLVLYKLLAGEHPYRIGGRSAAEAERMICETIPARPSTAVKREQATACNMTPERIRQTLRGDLDTIVLKALRKEPAQRYTSAEALVKDVRRYLDGLPVKARPATFSYRARKFAGRHRWSVALTALVLLSLLTGLAGTTWQARRAAPEAYTGDAAGPLRRGAPPDSQ